MGIVVLGAVFVDIKGYPTSTYIPGGRNVGRVEQVPGGVSRNVVEDIANVELRPTFVSLVDDTGLGSDVVRQLKNHKVNTDYVLPTPDGMGTWLAVFDNQGDVCAAISKRPDLRPLIALLDEKGDEIFRDADSIALEIDMDKEIVKRVFQYAKKYQKDVYAVVSNMSIAVERRDFCSRPAALSATSRRWASCSPTTTAKKTPEELKEILALKIRSARIPRMIVTMGAQGRCTPTAPGTGRLPRPEGGREGHHRRGRRLLCRSYHRPDLWQDPGRILRDRHPAGRLHHLHQRQRVPPVPAGGVRPGRGGNGLRRGI